MHCLGYSLPVNWSVGLAILATPNSDSAEIRGKSWKRALHYGIAFRHYSFLCRRYITRRDSANVKRRRHTTCMHRICRLLGLVFFSQIFQRLFEHFIRCFLRLLTSVTMVFFCEAAQCWAHDSKRKNPDFSVRENSAQRTQALAPAGWDSIPEVVVTTRESENYLVSRISRFSYLFRVARIVDPCLWSDILLLFRKQKLQNYNVTTDYPASTN